MAPCCSKYVLKEVHRPTSKSYVFELGDHQSGGDS